MNKLFGGHNVGSIEIRPVFHNFGNFCMGFCFRLSIAYKLLITDILTTVRH
jgi:hypothetical protein